MQTLAALGLTRQEASKLKETHRCAECGGMLDVVNGKYYGLDDLALACTQDKAHNGNSRRAYTADPLLNIYGHKRRDILSEIEKETGVNTRSIVKYQGALMLTREQGMEILNVIYPEAPEVKKLQVAMICQQYGLNPLMKHLFLVPFNKGKPTETWEIIQSIKAKRILAQRREPYTYLDMSPRRMTEAEEMKIYGEVDLSKIRAICILQGMSGQKVYGRGDWPKDQEVQGKEKGNSKLNMACIHAESNGIERLVADTSIPGVHDVVEEELIQDLFPAEEEEIIEGEATEVPIVYAEAEESHYCNLHETEMFKKGKMRWYSHPILGEDGKPVLVDGKAQWCNGKDKPEEPQDSPEASPSEAEVAEGEFYEESYAPEEIEQSGTPEASSEPAKTALSLDDDTTFETAIGWLTNAIGWKDGCMAYIGNKKSVYGEVSSILELNTTQRKSLHEALTNMYNVQKKK